MKRKLLTLSLALLLLCSLLSPTCLAGSIEITNITDHGNGQVTVSFKDSGNNGPYEILYFPQITNSYNDDMDNRPICWSNDVESSAKSKTINYLVPGVSYWINVTGANSNSDYTLYRPNATKQSSLGGTVTVTPRTNDGNNNYTDLSSLTVSQLTNSSESYGLHVDVDYYSGLNYDTEIFLQCAITTPSGYSLVIGNDTFTSSQGSTGRQWKFLSLDHYGPIIAKRLGWEAGSYKISVYANGALMGSDSFKVTGSSSTTSRPAQSNSSSSCKYCSGSGYCSHCAMGECDNCFGEGTVWCNRCNGAGSCPSCYGMGGEYRLSGGDLKWRNCSRCGGGGSCGGCGGSGNVRCSYCSGSGSCSYCRGRGNCNYCS